MLPHFEFRAACALGFISLLTVSGCGPGAAAVAPPVPKVTVQHPEVRELLDYDEYNGWTDASEVVEIRARVRGHIDKVHFTDGQVVKAGDLLFELDPRPYEAELERAKEQVGIYDAQLEVAIAEEGRQTELLRKTAATKRDVEEAIAKRKSYEAQTSAAKEEVRRREIELSYSKITAPIGGKISRAMMTAGNLVNAGGSDPLLTTIVTLNPIYVYFSVDERALLEYRKRRGANKPDELKPVEAAQIPFEFGLEIDKGYPHKGVLDFADNRIDSSTGTIQLRGKADNAAGEFLPGGRVRVRVPISDAYKGMLIPDTAILTDQDKKYVLTLNEKKNVVRRDVQLGKLLDDGMRVILPSEDKDKGIGPEDWVIVLGLQRARVGYPVEPLDENSNAIASTTP